MLHSLVLLEAGIDIFEYLYNHLEVPPDDKLLDIGVKIYFNLVQPFSDNVPVEKTSSWIHRLF